MTARGGEREPARSSISRRQFVRAGAAVTAGGLAATGLGGSASGQTVSQESCNSDASFQVGDGEVINNDWSTSTGTQCVFTRNDGSYGWRWDRPQTGACEENCPNYPEVLLGQKPWSRDSGAPGFPFQLGDLSEFEVDIELDNGASGGEWNVALEWWQTRNRPPIGGGDPSHEVMVLLEWSDTHDKGALVEEAAATDRFGNQYDLWEHVTDRVAWSFYIFRVAGNSLPNNLDLMPIYDYLYSVEGQDPYGFDDSMWIPGIEVGNETWDHSSGRTVVHNFDVRVNGRVATSGTDRQFTEHETPTPTATPTDTPTDTPTATETPSDSCSDPAAPAWSDGTTPYDVDADGVYEDMNGNCEFDSDDVVTYFQQIDRSGIQSNPSYYDANGNGNADFDDIVTLFQAL